MTQLPDIVVRQSKTNDADEICVIYNHYISNTIVTFEKETIDAEEILGRMNRFPTLPWIVAQDHSQVLGYAYATPWKERAAYKETVEVTVYVKHGHGGKGIGSALYQKLIEDLCEKKYYALLGGIALPNEASIKLHEKMGFTKVAQLKEVGLKFGKRIDVGYWELRIGQRE